ncbi:MAG: 4Fe-4S dicluster domain-containing protein [Flavobacteriales bacterium]|nr:(Fe-S)-binding protein [Flavobacteriaceae bacterium]MDO7581731.1 (Fe-S)-binding protein [Flavobacteriaceae bacterium]MDO7599191.1 (Fe-S)-binding protein [Flavobacteriaceae bacterium]MDO7603512.1 (Fe-S)-binding protein [Flavobacteriaceae bacterium]MDO7615813.1 (Fe-S)-binding protein [Flavobacteriaceae bacterium]
MDILPNMFFVIILLISITIFTRNILKIKNNINLGRSIDRSDNKSARWKNMARIALGQSKMVSRPIAGILHVVVYIGFLIINIELLEIVVDGIFGTHRVFAPFLGSAYNVLIATFEIFAFLVLLAVLVFWARRNIIRLNRFRKSEMKGWPKLDADLILYFEIVLMTLFLTMNGADFYIQTNFTAIDYHQAGSFPISQFMTSVFEGMAKDSVILVERTAWWMHIIGIFIFLNYLYYSKHLHILLAFPNTYFANLNAKGGFANNPTVTAEVKLMMDPDADPYAVPETTSDEPEKFGASDVMDLNRVQLLNAYTCTECGRCTSECPANQTGKLLSPRKIMMDTRDRLTEVGNNIQKNKGVFVPDGKQLYNDYITAEELWACTSCNACVQACPIDIDPLSIIMNMRQYLVMEESAAPADLNNMMGNIENNGAPWPFNQQDRLNWVEDL